MRPMGKPRTNFSVVPDSILLDVGLSGRARLVLVYIAGRPEGWVTTVTDIQRRLGLTVSQWKLTRDELRNARIVPLDHPKRLGGGVNRFTWVLDVFLERYYLSTSYPLKTDDAHPSETADGSHQPFSIDGKTTDYQQAFINRIKKPPTEGGVSRPVVVSDVDEGEAGAVVLAGLTAGESRRVRAALAGASEAQVSLFVDAWESQRATARSPAGLAVGLAKLAAKDALSPVLPESLHSSDALDAQQLCRERTHYIGDLVGPDGVVACCLSSSSCGLLHSPTMGAFTIQQSANFWNRVQRGELDFKPSK